MKTETDAMRNAVAGMFGRMGLEGVEFADEDGNVTDQIAAKPPPDVACDVPAHGGGTVSIKKGDRIRCWYRGEHSGQWFVEGKPAGREAVGTVLNICPEGRYDGMFCLAYQRDNPDSNEGPSSCTLKREQAGWARVVEKLP